LKYLQLTKKLKTPKYSTIAWLKHITVKKYDSILYFVMYSLTLAHSHRHISTQSSYLKYFLTKSNKRFKYVLVTTSKIMRGQIIRVGSNNSALGDSLLSEVI